MKKKKLKAKTAKDVMTPVNYKKAPKEVLDSYHVLLANESTGKVEHLSLSALFELFLGQTVDEVLSILRKEM